MTRALITSASNKFFPSLLNLLGSIQANYPNHPNVYVYDLGLFITFRKELEEIPFVHVIDMPHFVPFWRACYTWKTYILNTPIEELNFYLDAGNQVLRPLDEIFEIIENDGYFAVEQGGTPLEDITPKEYMDLFDLEPSLYSTPFLTAGIFGFKKDSIISPLMEKLHKAAIKGLCLGFSKSEQWKNKGVDKNGFIRNCRMFRHDTTVLSLILKKEIKDLKTQDLYKFGGAHSKHDHPDQLIWNLRMNYRELEYLDASPFQKWKTLIVFINRLILALFFIIRGARLKVKGL